MSLGLLFISAFSGLITAFGLYFGGQVGLAGGLGAYSMTGVLMALIVAGSLTLEAYTTKRP
jgi:hypothetical protein